MIFFNLKQHVITWKPRPFWKMQPYVVQHHIKSEQYLLFLVGVEFNWKMLNCIFSVLFVNDVLIGGCSDKHL